ncbi:hypothetical protein EDC04DRAFT_2599870 [Pisolithus marmoratus]|nr:hypothetical protein EDC04DRAFT_2599870 [Pisolithus marmoratus]
MSSVAVQYISKKSSTSAVPPSISCILLEVLFDLQEPLQRAVQLLPRLLNELADLLSPPSPEPGLHIGSVTTPPTHHPTELLELIELEEELFMLNSEETLSGNATAEQTCTTHPTEKLASLCMSWKAVIQTIIDPFIK